MTWFKMDDHFDENPKVIGLSDAAYRLYVAAMCYSSRNTSDGFVPVAQISRLGVSLGTERELVQAGLWEAANDGFVIHDYLKWQRSKGEIEGQREKWRDAKEAKKRKAQSSTEIPRGILTESGRVPSGISLSETETETDTEEDKNIASRADALGRTDGADVTPLRQVQEMFDRFWAVYPRHEAKAKALAAFRKALKVVDAESVIAAAERYRDDPNRDPQFTAHPATWLNAGRWDDEPLPSRNHPTAAPSAASIALRLAHEAPAWLLEVES